MSTEPAPPVSSPLPVEILENKIEKIDESSARLEQALAREADGRKAERFYWIATCTILFDAIVAPDMGLSFLPVFLLQLILLAGLSVQLGVEQFSVPLMRLYDHLTRRPSDNDKGE